jgi:uncharacterized membrane protein YciS (DUF1049 family)
MSNLWLRIKFWFKVTLVAAVFLYVIMFTAKNASEKAHFWYWINHQPETNLLYLVLGAFIAGVISTLLIRTTIRTMRQFGELQHRSRIHRIDQQIADIHTKAAMLQTKPPIQSAAPEIIESDEAI